MKILWLRASRLLLLILWIDDFKSGPTACEKQQTAAFVCLIHPHTDLQYICFNPLTSGVPTICNRTTMCRHILHFFLPPKWKTQAESSVVTDSSQGHKEHYIILQTTQHLTTAVHISAGQAHVKPIKNNKGEVVTWNSSCTKQSSLAAPRGFNYIYTGRVNPDGGTGGLGRWLSKYNSELFLLATIFRL